MDLTIPLENTTLNIRVAIILQTEKGYLLEQNKKAGWYFFLGGRIKVGESSLQAAVRETKEETGLIINDFTFVSVIENFYFADNSHKEGAVQEICFVYKAGNIKGVDPQFGLQEFSKDELLDLDLRPEIIKKIILEDKLNNLTHHIV